MDRAPRARQLLVGAPDDLAIAQTGLAGGISPAVSDRALFFPGGAPCARGFAPVPSKGDEPRGVGLGRSAAYLRIFQRAVRSAVLPFRQARSVSVRGDGPRSE